MELQTTALNLRNPAGAPVLAGRIGLPRFAQGDAEDRPLLGRGQRRRDLMSTGPAPTNRDDVLT